ncbi:MAG: hypothetical protein CL772_00085 [Chloroflexi bacterium]|nr:hypothetical protein [Chloroflexota bacterium]MBK89563.1 hypothetical protein [Chloroflexota bacterium]|tara:strand:- start:11984 stop:12460 length:477 start_codon:yes stop_codon:yes gene_type:complete
MPSEDKITDEMRSFIDLKTTPKLYTVEKHSVEQFATAIGDRNKLYFDEKYATEKVGGLLAPPTFIRQFKPNKLDKQFPDPFSNLVDGGSSYIFHEKIFVGDQIAVISCLKDLFMKNGSFGEMMFKISHTTYTNQNNVLVAEQEITTITYGKGEKTFLS